jgi:hydroxymethylpyrimidine pyrophosphatase-like HAD family hydrolase
MTKKMEDKETLVIDIDNTLLMYPDKKYDNILDKYNDAIPDWAEISLLNELWANGYIIILFTGRNWDKYNFTINQLKEIGIRFDQLIMGKPQGIYIDKDSFKTLKEAIK